MSVSVTSSVRSQFGLAALSAAARFWFAVMVAGQLVFATAVAAFYGRSAIRGDFNAWNRTMTHGYVSGEPLGNAAVAVHLAGAVVIILGGAIQLLPGLRKQAPAVHRWNGRAYLAAAVVTSVAGLIMIWTRGTVGDVGAHLGQSLDGVLILVFAALALRAALARDFRAHARWAMRLYLVVSAALFIRAGLILGVPLRFFTLMSFGQYLVPLAMLELYWRARDGGAVSRTAMAACLSGRASFCGGRRSGLLTPTRSRSPSRCRRRSARRASMRRYDSIMSSGQLLPPATTSRSRNSTGSATRCCTLGERLRRSGCLN